MIPVCISGQMGCGKTYVADILRQWGYPVYNCDQQAKRLMQNSPDLVAALTALIGPQAYLVHPAPQGYTLNKPVIAQYLYATPRNTRAVNQIVHPAVKADLASWLHAHQDASLTFVECALPRQSGISQLTQYTLYVTAPPYIQQQRIRQRDRLSDAEIQARLARQQDEQPHPINTYPINNDGQTPLQPLLKNILQKILQTT